MATNNATNTSNPITVSQGGTGDSSFTAYSVVCAGTTSTGQLQNVSGVGTSGQVLTSNGSSALPTWQANSGAFSPNATVNIYDDFIGCAGAATGSSWVQSLMDWIPITTNQFVPKSTTSNAHPGLVGNVSNNGTFPENYNFASGNPDSSIATTIILGGGAVTINFVFNIATLSNSTNRYTLNLGLGDTNSKNQANGCYIAYSDNLNSGNWEFITAAASTRTTSTSSTAVTSGWHNAQISINAGATSVSFSMDGVSLGTAITTNIPTNAVTPFFGFEWTAGTVAANSILIDLFYMTQTLTSTR